MIAAQALQGVLANPACADRDPTWCAARAWAATQELVLCGQDDPPATIREALEDAWAAGAPDREALRERLAGVSHG